MLLIVAIKHLDFTLRRNGRWMLALLLLLLPPTAGFAGQSSAPFSPLYVARGVLTEELLLKTRNRLQCWNFEFAEDKAGRWRMSYTTPISSLGIVSGEVIAYDGTNMFSTVTGQSMVVTVNGRPTAMEADDMSAATVSPGPYPVDHSSAVGAVWLAFVAGRHLPRDGRIARFPNLTVSDARLDPTAWSCDLKYDLLPVPVRPLLQSGDYLLNPQYVRPSCISYPELDDPDNKFDYRTQRNALRNLQSLARSTVPVILGRFRLDETQAVGTLLIPKRFRCILNPILQNGDVPPQPTVTMLGVVTNVEPSTEMRLLPSLRAHATVEDRRFRAKYAGEWRRSLIYAITNREWLVSTHDPRLQDVSAELPLRKYSKWDQEPTSQQLLIRILVLAGFVMPIWLLLLQRRVRLAHLKNHANR